MIIKFLQADIWNKITVLAKAAKHKHVAVAYLGKGATKLLPLNQGDVLVVDLRIETVRGGQVNPFEIEEYLKQGVEVYSYANLHAKVFVFDNKVIVGSTNVSNHSKNVLVESAILVNDITVANSARGFVASLMGAPVTPAFVKALEKEYLPPKIKGGKRSTNNEIQTGQPRLRIERVDPADFDEQENKLSKTGKVVARKKVNNKKEYSVEVIRCYRAGLGKNPSVGDLIIQLKPNEDDSISVFPPSRIVHFEPYTNTNGKKKILVFTEEPRNPNCLDWNIFKAALKKGGLPNASEKMGREIKNADLKYSLLGLWISRLEK